MCCNKKQHEGNIIKRAVHVLSMIKYVHHHATLTHQPLVMHAEYYSIDIIYQTNINLCQTKVGCFLDIC